VSDISARGVDQVLPLDWRETSKKKRQRLDDAGRAFFTDLIECPKQFITLSLVTRQRLLAHDHDKLKCVGHLQITKAAAVTPHR
jgi:hypothetical protein